MSFMSFNVGQQYDMTGSGNMGKYSDSTTYQDAMDFLNTLPDSKDKQLAIRLSNVTGQAKNVSGILNKLGYDNGGWQANSLANEYKKAYDEAKQANEDRYNDVLQGYEDRYDRNMGYINDRNDQGYRDIDQAWQEQQAQGNQDMVSRGLTGTTIAPTMNMGYERERIADRNRLANSELQQKLGVDAGLSKDTLDFKERRQDEYPDYRRFDELERSQARYGTAYSSSGNSFGGRYNVSHFGGMGNSGYGSSSRSSGSSRYSKYLDSPNYRTTFADYSVEPDWRSKIEYDPSNSYWKAQNPGSMNPYF